MGIGKVVGRGEGKREREKEPCLDCSAFRFCTSLIYFFMSENLNSK